MINVGSLVTNRADSLCRFFLLWSPDVYGDLTDADVEARGFQLITEDLEWEEPSPVHAVKPTVKKIKMKKNSRGNSIISIIWVLFFLVFFSLLFIVVVVVVVVAVAVVWLFDSVVLTT